MWVCVLSHFNHVWLCDPMDCSPPGSSVHGILRARILEWVTMPPPGDLPNPGIEPMSLMSPALAGGFFTTSTTWEDPGLSQTYCELCECRGTQSNEWFIEQIEQLTVWWKPSGLPLFCSVACLHPGLGIGTYGILMPWGSPKGLGKVDRNYLIVYSFTQQTFS